MTTATELMSFVLHLDSTGVPVQEELEDLADLVEMGWMAFGHGGIFIPSLVPSEPGHLLFILKKR